MSVPSEWQGILREGEEILWQGAPDPRVRWSDLGHHELGGGVATIVLTAISPLILAEGGAGAAGALLVLGIGLFVLGRTIAKPLLERSERRRRSFYTLSDRAAYVGIGGEKRIVERHAIRPDLPLDLIELGGSGTVTFHEEWIGNDDGGYLRRTGFEHIEEAEHVFALMSDLRGTPTDDIVWNRPVIRA